MMHVEPGFNGQFSLTTERLLLRPFSKSDLEWFASLLGHPEVMHFSPKGPLGHKDAAEILHANQVSFQLRGFGLMACILKEQSIPIGFCGVCLREIDSVLYPELGYRFFPHAWGNGYATEAAAIVRDDAFCRLKIAEVVSFIDPLNIRSIRVATKIGETFGFHANFRGIEIAVYKLLRRDFLERIFTGIPVCGSFY